MTSERKWVAEPSDILLIELICKKCGASLALNPTRENHFIRRECPNCSNEWMIQDSLLHQATTAIFRGIRTLQSMQNEASFRLRLQLSEPTQAVSQKVEPEKAR